MSEAKESMCCVTHLAIWPTHEMTHEMHRQLKFWVRLLYPSPIFSWTLLLVLLGFSPFTIKLSWAFIRMCLEIFNSLPQIWAYNAFITFLLSIHYHLFFFFFFWSNFLARIYFILPLKVHVWETGVKPIGYSQKRV